MADFLEYFTLLDILPAFDLDLTALETHYFQQQRNNHPDRFVGKPNAERLAALQRSADINLAYETLKDPLKRAQYLLLLQGMYVGTEKDTVKPSQELLAEMMELRENIDELTEINALYAFVDEVDEMRRRLLNFIDVAYNKGQWDKMAQLVLKLGYVQKAMNDLTKQKAKMVKAGKSNK